MNLIVLAFENETHAFEMRTALVELEHQGMIEMKDAVVVTRDAQGKVQLHQSISRVPGAVAAGSLVGMVVGMLFLNPLFGSVVGAGTGAIVGSLRDAGINDDFMKDIGDTIAPGTSALFLLTSKGQSDKIIEKLKPFAGVCKVLQTSLPGEKEQELRKFMEGS